MANRKELKDDSKRELILQPKETLPQEKLRRLFKEAISRGGKIVEITLNNGFQLTLAYRLLSAHLNVNEVEGTQDLPNGKKYTLSNGSTIQMVHNATPKETLEGEKSLTTSTISEDTNRKGPSDFQFVEQRVEGKNPSSNGIGTSSGPQNETSSPAS
jgi:hypothetical protein